MGKKPEIAIIMATMLEAKPFVQDLALEQSASKPFKIFRNQHLLLMIAGIGKANAAAATTYILERINPSCICNLGAAGATDFSHHLGEILHITEIIEFDGPEFDSPKSRIHLPTVLAGVKSAILATSDTAVLDPEHRQKLSVKADLVDMEGAVIAQACQPFQIKCVMFKFVSDTPVHIDDENIVKNIRLYRTPFCEFFRDIVMPILVEKNP